MTSPTDSRPDLLTVIAYMRAQPGKEQELKDALEALVAPTRQEAGYVTYEMYQGLEDPAVFFFYENWESAAHLDAHLQAPHLTQLIDVMDDLIDGGLTITRLRRVA